MVNDSTIIFGILAFFVTVGAILPIINSTFGGASILSNDFEALLERKDVISENETTICLEERFNVIFFQIPFESCYNKQEVNVENINKRQESSWLSYVTNIGQIFFWTFGGIPFYIDLFIFVPLRLILGILIFRTIRSGAG